MCPAVGYGLIGCGLFGQFCLEQYRSVPDLQIVAISDELNENARLASTRFGFEACPSPGAMLARDDIELVHIATPPFTHYPLVAAALEAGKHVLCEKPLALTPDEARALARSARQHNRMLAVNMPLRHNPLCTAIKHIISKGLLGRPLHAHFHHDARDNHLPPDHWFWQPEMSGGIFVETGVHFFDLFEFWFGPGEVLSANGLPRFGSSQVDQVECTVRYADNVMGRFYHGYHQPEHLERQEGAIAFERGIIRFYGYVPDRIEIDCLATRETFQQLTDLFPQVDEVKAIENYQGSMRRITGRHNVFEVDGHFRIRAAAGMDFTELYGYVLRSLIEDLLARLKRKNTRPHPNVQQAIASLETATQANRQMMRTLE